MTAKTPAQYHEAVVRALEDTERLSGLVNILLQLAQAEGGQVPLDRERLRLANLLTDVLDQFQPLADEKNQSIVCTVEPEVTLMADRLQVERLIANLISNAIKYTPSGGSITISAQTAGDFTCLQVEDTGVGIAPENLPHVFERFYRVRGQLKSERGLGLGLSFVDVIARAHGGRVEATSVLGEGTCFKVYLPNAPAARPDHLRA
jgi:signal transduction histidine kinase